MTYQSNTPSQENKMGTQPADREKYLNETKEKLGRVQAKIHSMKDEGSRMAGDLKKKADENLAKLETKYSELKTKIDDFKDATDEKWSTTKEAFEKSFTDLSTNFKGIFNK